MNTGIRNVNIVSQELLSTPKAVKESVPITPKAEEVVLNGRSAVEAILDGRDSRLLLVVGPCSIHDTEAALEYAEKLSKLAEEVNDTLLVVMRVYFEKPRTTVGWKGFINDPHLNDSFSIDEGLVLARKLLIQISEMGLPAGTEALDPITPQYFDDLIAWSAIGARTTESQTHREMASGLSTPVGFKNGTDGSVDVAINAMRSSAASHNFLGMNEHGQVSVLCTAGNKYSHIVLRGGSQPNYDSVNVALCEKSLAEANLPLNIMIDCSHANSHKKPEMQPLVLQDSTHQILEGNNSIIGMMVESNLVGGNQSIPNDRSQLKYGVSVTDGCLGWDDTEKAIRHTHEQLKPILKNRKRPANGSA